MSAAEGPPGFPIPIRLGDRVVWWAAVELAGPCAEDAPRALVVVPTATDVLAVRTGRRGFTVIPQASITYATSQGGLVTVHADTGRYWRDGRLADTAVRLDPRRFLRLDASHVVNLARITELVPWTHQRYRLVFGDAAKTELMLSRDVGRRRGITRRCVNSRRATGAEAREMEGRRLRPFTHFLT